MTPFAALIPLPQRCGHRPGRFRTPATWQVEVACADPRVGQAAQRWLGRTQRVDAGAAADLRLHLGRVDGLPAGLDPALAAEAYRLAIGPDGVTVTANAAVGLVRALATLAQLLTLEPRSLPGAVVTDWPALVLRNAHLTLGNGFQPPFPELLAFVERLAWFKVSSVTIEYDDAFSWEKYPFLARPSALTKDQSRELQRLADELFIEVVPLVDSLGHQHHVLHHPQLAHLRELPDSAEELCPSNPAGLAFIKDLWSEVLEVHRGARWVNITGDETFRLGRFCPRCGERAARGELGRLYGEHYRDLIRWMLERGHRPMMWHDMLCRHPDELASWPREVALIYWNYWGVDQDAHELSLGYHGYVWPDEVAREPAAVQRMMAPYWPHPQQPGRFRPWAQLHLLKDLGFATVAASGGSCMERPVPFMGYRSRVENPKALARTVAGLGGLGLVHTFWSDYVSPLAGWHSLAAAADHAWQPRAEDAEGFLARFGRLFHGIPGSAYVAATRRIDYAIYPEHPPLFPAPRPQHRAGDAGRALATLRRGARRNRQALDLVAPAVAFLDLEEQLRATAHTRFLAGLPQGEDRVVDLGAAVNGDLMRLIPGDGGSRLRIAPGEQRSNGVLLRILPGPTNAVMTASARNPGGHQRVEIAVGGTADLLCFCHTAGYVRRGQEIGAYEVRWADGRSERLPVVGGVHIGDWYGGDSALDGAGVAWEDHLNPYCQTPVRLYLMPWRNPRPQVEIAAVAMLSAQATGHLCLAALTARTATGGALAVARGTAPARRALQRTRRTLRAAHAACVVPEHLPLAATMLGLPRYAGLIGRLSSPG